MGYLHIENLYKNQTILLFRECYALEKVHGTSAHVAWQGGAGAADARLSFFSGGEKHDKFRALFDDVALRTGFERLGHTEVTVFGEAYGGSCQGMKATYGDSLRFIVFDVRVGETWLAVNDMAQVAEGLGLEVVPYSSASSDLATLDALRDASSEVAVRRGCGEKPREGIVLRPLVEMILSNGSRVIAKHKGETFAETKTPRKVVDPAALVVLADAEAIAVEYVTEMRLSHVLDKLPEAKGLEQTGMVIKAMVEDVLREAAGEVVDSKAARQAIGKRAAALYKQRICKIEKED